MDRVKTQVGAIVENVAYTICLVLSRYVMGRYNYSTVRVRPMLSDITAIRLSVLATLLTNRHDSTKQMVILEMWQSG
jgi:hypothetical protein